MGSLTGSMDDNGTYNSHPYCFFGNLHTSVYNCHNFRGLLVLDPEPKDTYCCHPYHFMEICKPPVNESIGSYQIHHLNYTIGFIYRNKATDSVLIK